MKKILSRKLRARNLPQSLTLSSFLYPRPRGLACYAPRMNEFISQLVAKADLSEAQAAKVAEVVRGFLANKLPDAVRGPVDSALTGQNVDNAVDQAKGLLDKLF